uniref:Uncharacterized protein n=1 Tax=candidate division CPR3 bacterium TaxID=2268181 RepID=A0A7V3J9A3_UNCC3
MMFDDDKKAIIISKSDEQTIERDRYSETTGLTPAQKSQMIMAGINIAENLMDIARNIIEIAKVEKEGKIKIDLIKAKTEQVISKIRAETAQLQKKGEIIDKKGKIVVDILDKVRQIINDLPEADSEVRLRAIEKLPEIINMTLSSE